MVFRTHQLSEQINRLEEKKINSSKGTLQDDEEDI
jgi:hypothetical protein